MMSTTLPNAHQLTPLAASPPETPTLDAWVALIKQHPAQARKLIIAIRVRSQIQGLLADPALTISMHDYDEAQRLLAAAQEDRPRD